MDESTEASARRRLVLVILTGLGLLLLLGGTSWLVVDRVIIGQGNVAVPDSLAGLSLSEQVSGRAALAEIERLHGKGIPLIDGAVALYGDGVATLWVSNTWMPFLAARQVEAMTDRIAEGRSPFTPIGTREVEGTTVYTLTGMGQMHYYFQLDRRVAWLAAAPQIAERSLVELVRGLQ